MRDRLIEAGLSAPSVTNVELVNSQPILLPVASGIASQPPNIPTINGIIIPGVDRIPFLDMTRIAHQFLAPIPTSTPQIQQSRNE